MRTTLFLVVTLFSSTVVAQAPAERPATTGTERASDVPDDAKKKRSTEAIARMRQILREVLTKLEEARATKDVVKLNCVNEKLTQIKGLLRISEQSDVALQEAIARGESSASEHEYTKVVIARQKVEVLRGEAEECIGQLAFRTDENLTVEVEEPEGLPEGDPTDVRTLPPVLFTPPPMVEEASPVQ